MKRLLIFLFIFSQSIFAFAGAVRFEVKVSSQRLEVGQRFQISFSLNEKGNDFRPPAFNKFQLLSGPNQSSSMQYVNGKVSKNFAFSYILRATEKGTFTIGSANVTVNGKNYKTQAVEITVVESSRNNAANARNQNQQKRNEENAIKDNVFVKAIIDKRDAYVGEKILVTYKLYSRLTLTNLNLEKMPALNGFWTQDIKSIYDEIELSDERINGVNYKVAELQKSILYPQRSGELEIDPIEIKVGVQTRSQRRRSVFDQIFGSYESKEVKLSSSPIQVKVKSLPTSGKPVDFSGAVGRFKMSAEINKDSVNQNEAIDLKIIISGTGNLPLLSSPKLNFPPDFEVYDPETTSNIKTTFEGASGSKIFNYLVIPRQSGKFNLKPYTFNYFDLNSKAYRSITSDTLKIQVEKGKGEIDAAAAYQPSRKKDVEMLNSDIRYIHRDEISIFAANDLFYDSPLFYSLILLSVILMIAAYFLTKRLKEKQTDLVGMRKAKATKVAKKRLTKAKKLLHQKDYTSYYVEISNALYGYFADKFNLSLSEISQEKILTLLKERKSDDLLSGAVKNLLEEIEMARFAANSGINAKKLYQQSVEVISKTENLKA